MQRKLIVLSLVLNVALMGLIVYQARRQKRDRDRLDALEQRLSEQSDQLARLQSARDKTVDEEEAQALMLSKLQAEFVDLRQEAQALRATVARAQKSGGEATPPAEQSGETATGDQDSEASGASMPWREWLEDPEGREMFREQQKSYILMLYGELLEALALPEEQKKQFMDILLDQQMLSMELGWKLWDESLDSAERKQLQEKLAGESNRFTEAMKALLGPQHYSLYEEYNKSIGDRSTLMQFEQQLAASGTPLEEYQHDSIIEIYGQVRREAPGSPESLDPQDWMNDPSKYSGEALTSYFRQQEEVDRRVLTRARSVLTPSQHEAFETFLQTQRRVQQFWSKRSSELFGEQAEEQ